MKIYFHGNRQIVAGKWVILTKIGQTWLILLHNSALSKKIQGGIKMKTPSISIMKTVGIFILKTVGVFIIMTLGVIYLKKTSSL